MILQTTASLWLNDFEMSTYSGQKIEGDSCQPIESVAPAGHNLREFISWGVTGAIENKGIHRLVSMRQLRGDISHLPNHCQSQNRSDLVLQVARAFRLLFLFCQCRRSNDIVQTANFLRRGPCRLTSCLDCGNQTFYQAYRQPIRVFEA